MALSVFLSRKEHCACKSCGHDVHLHQPIVTEEENGKGLCLRCAGLTHLTFLPSGNVALTRRSQKLSSTTAILRQWNQRTKRYERRGIYVEAKALAEAQQLCESDAALRAEKKGKAAITRENAEKIYVNAFATAIRQLFPSAPRGREFEIARHACEKHSGRVGRTALAKEFDEAMITRAVIAHIRHAETEYDALFGQGKRKREIRHAVKSPIDLRLKQWQKSLY